MRRLARLLLLLATTILVLRLPAQIPPDPIMNHECFSEGATIPDLPCQGYQDDNYCATRCSCSEDTTWKDTALESCQGSGCCWGNRSSYSQVMDCGQWYDAGRGHSGN